MRWLGLALACIAAVNTAAAGPAGEGARSARVAIIIDDLGDSLRDGRRVIALPGPVACAILPHTPHARALAQGARDAGKEVMLHLPMEPIGEDYEPGPGVLAHNMGPLEVAYTIDYDLDSVPYVTGINNHMGSRLTAERQPMAAVMRAIARRGNLFFVDSVTTPVSVAAEAARREGIPTLARDVFLDSDPTEAAVEQQLDALLRTARQRGQAVAIAHPHPATLAVLERRLPQLAAQGVELVSPSELLVPAGVRLVAKEPLRPAPADQASRPNR